VGTLVAGVDADLWCKASKSKVARAKTKREVTGRKKHIDKKKPPEISQNRKGTGAGWDQNEKNLNRGKDYDVIMDPRKGT